jgi:hypothetical protein
MEFKKLYNAVNLSEINHYRDYEKNYCWYQSAKKQPASQHIK